MTTRAYCRCNGGCYFQGEHCPFDGWSSAASRELTKAVKRLRTQGQAVSLAALRKAGASRATLERTIVIAFGNGASAFEALAPSLLVVNEEAKPVHQLDANFQ